MFDSNNKEIPSKDSLSLNDKKLQAQTFNKVLDE